jgi:hypothetical protein
MRTSQRQRTVRSPLIYEMRVTMGDCRPRKSSIVHRQSSIAKRGQSLIVAVIVLFVLLFIGGIFVAMVARNLLNTGRTRETVGAQQFAEAGIRYAEQFLQYGSDGADWRPQPSFAANANDPDSRWLNDGSPTGAANAWTRVDLGNGRALIRISYMPSYVPDPTDPNPDLAVRRKILNPLGKYIRIESVGRSGFLDPNDPTTFLNSPPPRLYRKLIAYKAIGLTDFVRFVTNKNSDAKFLATLGVPFIGLPLSMQIGGLPVLTPNLSNPNYHLPGAAIYVNGDLQLMGDLLVGLDRRNDDAILVSGQIQADAVNPPHLVDLENGGPPQPIYSSDNSNFLTYQGKIRDNGPNPDRFGYARGVPPLSVPLIDAPDPATGATRYRQLTRLAGSWITDPRNGRSFNTGIVGFGGPGIYINNPGSRELESRNVPGVKSLRSVWIEPGSNNYWHGPFYIPPGVFVEFGYQLVNDPVSNQPVSVPGFRIVRDDPRGFINPNDPTGNSRFNQMVYTFFIYRPTTGRPVVKLDNPVFRQYLKGVFNQTDDQVDAWLPEFNGVLYAEGNVRVRGLLPAKANLPVRGPGSGNPNDANPPSMTIVSGATLYVEGSLVSENPETKIGLLATDYVAVNTTTFVATTTAEGYHSSFQEPYPPFHTDLTTGIGGGGALPYQQDFIFGDNPTGYTPFGGQGQVPVNMLIRQGTPLPGVAYANLFVNQPLVTDPTTQNPAYIFAEPNLPPTVHQITDPTFQPNDTPRTWFEQRQFQLFPPVNNATYPFVTLPGFVNTLRPQADPNYVGQQGVGPYYWDHAEVVPMDVRIEAVIYAQNGSFFIIPGYPLNMDPDDTRNRAEARAQERGYTGQINGGPPMIRPEGTSSYYPFYNEPIDCRITIVGAISENRTAAVSDQAAWMTLWGYVPVSYGSTGYDPLNPNAPVQFIPDQHVRIYEVGGTAPAGDPRTLNEQNAGITRGLRFLYDPSLALPYQGYDAPAPLHAGSAPFRRDDYGRILPPLPRLPLCPGFVFYGEVR